LVITNSGPDTAGADAPVGVAAPVSLFSTVRVNAAQRLPVVVQPRDVSACRIEFVEFEPPPGDRQGFIFVLGFPQLAVGESRTCVADARIDSTQSHSISIGWRATSLRDFDPDPSNHSAAALFSMAATPVPGVSSAGIAALAAGMLAMAIRRSIP